MHSLAKPFTRVLRGTQVTRDAMPSESVLYIIHAYHSITAGDKSMMSTVSLCNCTAARDRIFYAIVLLHLIQYVNKPGNAHM